jgi:DNA-binding NarL/FixJ family response regulator
VSPWLCWERHHADPPATRGPLGMLTPREREILALVAEGRRNAEIGEAPCSSPLTAKTYLSGILKKLAARKHAWACREPL